LWIKGSVAVSSSIVNFSVLAISIGTFQCFFALVLDSGKDMYCTSLLDIRVLEEYIENLIGYILLPGICFL
jgi:hypothetical protein